MQHYNINILIINILIIMEGCHCYNLLTLALHAMCQMSIALSKRNRYRKKICRNIFFIIVSKNAGLFQKMRRTLPHRLTALLVNGSHHKSCAVCCQVRVLYGWPMTRPSAVAPPVRRMRHASATSGGEWRSATVTPDTPETELTSAPVGGGKCAHTRRNKHHVYVIRTTRAAIRGAATKKNVYVRTVPGLFYSRERRQWSLYILIRLRA